MLDNIDDINQNTHLAEVSGLLKTNANKWEAKNILNNTWENITKSAQNSTKKKQNKQKTKQNKTQYKQSTCRVEGQAFKSQYNLSEQYWKRAW